MQTIVVPDTQNLSDELIVERILKGEKRLYELLIRKYNQRLYRVGMSILKDEAEAEEQMQVAYIKAYENLASFKGKASFGTWLTRILINECLKTRKKQAANTIEQNEDRLNSISNMETPHKTLLNKELSKALEDALTALPEKYRTVFVLREMENMSIAETVGVLGVTEANVKVRLNRAKTMLRDSLSSYYKSDSIYNFHLSKCDRIVSKVLNYLNIAAS